MRGYLGINRKLPAVFQRIMSSVRQGVNGVVCYLDDMLITGKISDEYL